MIVRVLAAHDAAGGAAEDIFSSHYHDQPAPPRAAVVSAGCAAFPQ